jgi:hypothetical protein
MRGGDNIFSAPGFLLLVAEKFGVFQGALLKERLRLRPAAVQIGSAQYSGTRATRFVAANSGYAAGTFHGKRPERCLPLGVCP